MNMLTMLIWLMGVFSGMDRTQQSCEEPSSTCRSAAATTSPTDSDELSGPPPSPRISNGF